MGSVFNRLRDLARTRAQHEKCELCGTEIAAEHAHILERESRRLLCSCEPCAILFSDPQSPRYRRVPTRVERLTDFTIADPEWEDLRLPINLAFFYRSSAAGRVVAVYPSPAGATESLLPLDSWETLERVHPVLRKLEEDVAALLVNRTGETPMYFLVPIDQCYKLVGVIRMHWRGLSGGTEVWKAIKEFFDRLQARSVPHNPTVSSPDGSAKLFS